MTDHLNRVRDIAKYDPGSDMTTVVNHLIYDAFGKVTAESNPTIDSLFLFTGRPFDSDTQLQNNLNRWYDARVGRWLSEDPIGFAGGDGNLYRYVGNGTLRSSDPSGKNPSDALWKYWNNGRLPKAWAIDLTASAVLGTGFAGALQIVFFGDTCEFGLFAIGPAAANPTMPIVNNPLELLKHAAKRFFLDLPWGYDISLSANVTVAYSNLQGEQYADAASWTGVSYGANVDIGAGPGVGGGGFVSADGHWWGGSLGAGVSVPGSGFRTNPQYVYRLASIKLKDLVGDRAAMCVCYSLVAGLP